MPELPLVVSRECCMRGPSWIDTGSRLWQEFAHLREGLPLAAVRRRWPGNGPRARQMCRRSGGWPG
eukprot:4345858-Pyramimonas_sp.AAC.1